MGILFGLVLGFIMGVLFTIKHYIDEGHRLDGPCPAGHSHD
jgi:hypothetical protein